MDREQASGLDPVVSSALSLCEVLFLCGLSEPPRLLCACQKVSDPPADRVRHNQPAALSSALQLDGVKARLKSTAPQIPSDPPPSGFRLITRI